MPRTLLPYLHAPNFGWYFLSDLYIYAIAKPGIDPQEPDSLVLCVGIIVGRDRMTKANYEIGRHPTASVYHQFNNLNSNLQQKIAKPRLQHLKTTYPKVESIIHK